MYQENRRLFNTFRPHRLFNSFLWVKTKKKRQGRHTRKTNRKVHRLALHYSGKPFIRPVYFDIFHCVSVIFSCWKGQIIPTTNSYKGTTSCELRNFSLTKRSTRWRKLQDVLATHSPCLASNSNTCFLWIAFEAHKDGPLRKADAMSP